MWFAGQNAMRLFRSIAILGWLEGSMSCMQDSIEFDSFLHSSVERKSEGVSRVRRRYMSVAVLLWSAAGGVDVADDEMFSMLLLVA